MRSPALEALSVSTVVPQLVQSYFFEGEVEDDWGREGRAAIERIRNSVFGETILIRHHLENEKRSVCCIRDVQQSGSRHFHIRRTEICGTLRVK